MRTPGVALPEAKPRMTESKSNTRMFQARVCDKLYQAAKTEWRQRGLTAQQVADWALNMFLLYAQGKAAPNTRATK